MWRTLTLERTGHSDTGVIDENVDQASRLYRFRNTRGLGYVQREHANATRPGQKVLTRCPRCRDHVPASTVEVARCLEPVPRRAASDQDGLHDLTSSANAFGVVAILDSFSGVHLLWLRYKGTMSDGERESLPRVVLNSFARVQAGCDPSQPDGYSVGGSHIDASRMEPDDLANDPMPEAEACAAWCPVFACSERARSKPREEEGCGTLHHR